MQCVVWNGDAGTDAKRPSKTDKQKRTEEYMCLKWQVLPYHEASTDAVYSGTRLRSRAPMYLPINLRQIHIL